jgi:hypothetical protein
MDEAVSRRKAMILLALGILTVLLVGIGGPLWTALNEQLARPVIVLGTITDTAGKKLEGINVQVYRWEDHQWDAINAVDTNNFGYYRFTGLKAGRYTVAFEDDSGVGYLASWWGGGITARAAHYRELAPGSTGTFNDHVVLGAAITGHATVTDPDRGAVDATQFGINAYPITPKAGGGYTIHWTTSVSSLGPVIAGDWRIQNLPTGSYVLQAVDGDEYPALNAMLGSRWVGVPASSLYSKGQWTSAEVFNVVDGHVYSSPSVNMTYSSPDPHPALVLTVKDAAGQPIAGAAVDLVLAGGDQSTFSSGVHGAPFTNAAGTVGVYRATPGTYYLMVTRRGYAPYTETIKFNQGQSGSSTTTVVLQSVG